ncbi:MAG: VWA domain-containing protein, partial [Pseudomonadales bacterium]
MNLLGIHWIRPEWLLALLPALLFALLLWRKKPASGAWSEIISAELLPYLLASQPQQTPRWPIYGLLLAWLIACLALAGPALEELPVPLYERQDALVIVLDMSPSMLAQDVKPSRVVRARREIYDILKQRTEGTTALVIYSGDAFIVSPLTTDTDTIALLVNAISPGTLPVLGNNPTAAIELAHTLLTGAQQARGRLLWITDEIPTDDLEQLREQLTAYPFTVSIMGIGTASGAPIPLAKGGFVKDDKGAMVIPRYNYQTMKQLAADVGGHFIESSVDDRDLDMFLSTALPELLEDEVVPGSGQFDQWQDEAPWLVLLLLPLALAGFRRGWLLSLCIVPMLMPSPAEAGIWQDLWQSPDQQAANAYENGELEQAASLFEDPDWKASALYKGEQYDKAAELWQQDKTAQGHYNRGNALAHQGEIKEAIEAYQEALDLNPDMEDASFNKSLLEEQQQDKNQQSDEKNQQNDQDQKQNNDDNQDPSSEDGESGQPPSDQNSEDDPPADS